MSYGKFIEKIPIARNRLINICSDGIWLGSQLLWIGVTSVLTLAVPVLFHYEKECQMFELHAQMIQAQSNINSNISQ
ncbi:hypothetical protein ACR3K2_14310 [Cryptosporidium serpentis]